MGEDDIVTQMGLMLTQLRYARRALEDIERSTARYAGFAFASALQAGPAFGAPPLLDGALKVYVVNINDLAPGTGFGGFLESLLGGVGRFFGGLVGGFVGGTISGFNLPGVVASMLKLAERIEHILTMLGMSFGDKDKDKGKGEKKPEGPTLKSQLDDIKVIIDAFTALFTSATNPDKAAEIVKPKTDAGVQWLGIFQTADSLVRGISRVVDGLIILIPTLVGALASVIVHLRDIQTEVLSLLRFLLKEVFLLRGVLLFTLYDTIAGAARLASQVLSTLSVAVQTILTSVGAIFTKIFDAGLAILKFLAQGLKNTVDTLLTWLVKTVGVVLTALGDSKIFRVVVHLVQVLPAVLPPLLTVLDKPVSDVDRKALADAAGKTVEKPQFEAGVTQLIKELPKFPDVASTLAPKTEMEGLGEKVKTAFEGVQKDLKDAFSASSTALDGIAARLDEVKKDKSFLDALDQREKTLRESAKNLADSLTAAQKLAGVLTAGQPGGAQSGLQKIATAYEEWLTGGGMKTVLEKIDAHFKESPVTGVFGPEPAAVERPRATVEIKELLIELDPAADITGRPPEIMQAALPPPPGERDDEFEREHELKERGFTWAPGALMGWA
ncbi:MAG TPA: hypothetical protein VF591_25905 [Pyrinomonadaceae bacterium]|jgi:hypothetical protein